MFDEGITVNLAERSCSSLVEHIEALRSTAQNGLSQDWAAQMSDASIGKRNG